MSDRDGEITAEELKSNRWDAVYISPHLDDVSFSCPAAAREDCAAGDRVVEVVLFSRAADDSSEETLRRYERRREEQLRAARLGDWQVCFAGFVDAPYRPHPHRDFNSIVWGTSPNDDDIVDRLADGLAEVAAGNEGANVVGPLGVGRHIDHRLAHRAARRIAAENDVELWFYEDRPYALVPEAIELRLGELGVPTDPELEAFFEAFWETRYVAHHLTDPEERETCRRNYVELAEQLPDDADSDGRLRASTRLFESKPTDDLWDIPLAHTSQVEAFLGSARRFRKACRDYARRLESGAEYAERQWQLHPPSARSTD